MRNFLSNYIFGLFRIKLVRLISMVLLSSFLLVIFWPISKLNYSYSTIINDSKGRIDERLSSIRRPVEIPQTRHSSFQNEGEHSVFRRRVFLSTSRYNPISMVRATWQNVSAGRVISGASTITMQIARMKEGNKRTFGNKLKEMILALKIELNFSKKEIMIMYTSMAPFGGNVVGLEAASWSIMDALLIF